MPKQYDTTWKVRVHITGPRINAFIRGFVHLIYLKSETKLSISSLNGPTTFRHEFEDTKHGPRYSDISFGSIGPTIEIGINVQ